MESKAIDSLRADDLHSNPVWQFVSEDESGDETRVRPVKRLPVSNLTGKVIATQVMLANGVRRWALLGNIDVDNPKLTEHFITLSIENSGKWFTLARYHDFDYADRGPAALSRFLGLSVAEVFPISYDVRQHVKGHAAELASSLPKEPREKLSRAQIIAMAVP